MSESDTRRSARADIASDEDIARLVSDFYARAFRDDLLGPVFVDVAGMDLAAHLPVMCEFWRTVLFHTGGYRRNALQPHLRLDARAHLNSAHFDRWLALWSATVDERHAGPKAELAKVQATRIAGAISRRITSHRARCSDSRPRLSPEDGRRTHPSETMSTPSSGSSTSPSNSPSWSASVPPSSRAVNDSGP
jgi:hemoglobin